MSIKEICAEILRIRTVRKIGVRQMAKEIGISPATLNRIEKGKTTSVEVAAKIGPWAGKCACCGQSVGIETTCLTEMPLPLAGKDIATLTSVELVTEVSRLLSTIADLQRENEALKKDRYDLAYAITGGEDAPGLLDSTPTSEIVEIAQHAHRCHHADIDRAMAAEAEVEHYRAALYEIATNDEYRILTAEEAQTVAQKALASTGGEHHGN